MVKSGSLQVGAVIEAELVLLAGEKSWKMGTISRVNAAARSFRAAFNLSEDGGHIELGFSMKKLGCEWRWPVDAAANEATPSEVMISFRNSLNAMLTHMRAEKCEPRTSAEWRRCRARRRHGAGADCWRQGQSSLRGR